MKKHVFAFIIINAIIISNINPAKCQTQNNSKSIFSKADTRVDNNGYWKIMAKKGLAKLNPDIKVEPAIYKGSKIKAGRVITQNSPDVPVTTQNCTQSENSVFINPNDNNNVLNSNNSTTNPAASRSLYGANDFYTFDGGDTWDGELEGAGGSNSGDPATAISRSGRYYVGYISSGMGMGISYSTDQGTTWTPVNITSTSSDKNHLWVDNSISSPYEGNVYNVWTSFGGSTNDQIVFSRSTDEGLSYSVPMNISSGVSAGNHNQGVNINTGPNGEVYAVWAIYDSWPSDETAIGFAKSLDGGETFETAFRIIENIRGIRTSETSKNMRVNSFPVMAVDISGGVNNGNLYVVWSNIGEPGINTGSDIDGYMIKSTDEGETWSDPVRINQDPTGQGKEHYFPWITCDPGTGVLSVIFYDDRNVSSTQCEVFCANSYDAGNTWEDFLVSDVSFTPSPIPGLAFGYFGDYLGITAKDGKVYPCWTDNRTGTAMTYVSPYQVVVVNNPYNLSAILDDETGEVDLQWSHIPGVGFVNFKIYRNDIHIGSSLSSGFTDNLPDYGYYNYKVTACYIGNLESDPATAFIQWGNAQIAVNPLELYDSVLLGETSVSYFTIYSNGELELDYYIKLFANNNSAQRDYCAASGGCREYISNVQLGDINNSSDCDEYADYTNLSTTMSIGDEYEITITNGNPNSLDKCGIWIDWNQNLDFADDESIIVNGSPGTGPYTATIVPPLSALNGTTRMRIRINYFNILDPCGIESYGEVEDYSINVIDWISVIPYEGNIPPNDSAEIQLIIDGNKIEQGFYNYNVTTFNNDPDNPEITIPFSFTVVPMFIDVFADPQEICSGGSTQLFTTVTGGSGNYSYSWTSIPEGFTSAEQNPVFEPLEENTLFIVEVDDGEYQVNSDISLTVNPGPDVNLGNDTSICQGESIVLNAGSGYISYLWQNGSTGQTFIATTEGIFWVEVTNEFNCIKRDSLVLDIKPSPDVNIGNDTSICQGESLVLNAGSGYVSYLWQNGSAGQTINASNEGIYWVEVTNEFDCTGSDSLLLTLYPSPIVELGNDTSLCLDQSITLDAGNPGSAYLWSTEETTQIIEIDSSNVGMSSVIIWVQVTNTNQCLNSDSILITFTECGGIAEIEDNISINVFPNPNDGTFNLELTLKNKSSINIKVLNPLGIVVFEENKIEIKKKYSKTIKLGNFSEGIYSLIIEDINKIYNTKIVIQ